MSREEGAEGQPNGRRTRAAALMAALNRSMRSQGEVTQAKSLSIPWITKRLPTGLLGLDIALRGGFPAGAVSALVGPRHTCKSYLYWQVIRQLQHILGEKMAVLLAMSGLHADRTQALRAGVRVALAEEDISGINRARVDNGVPAFTNAEIADMRRETGTIHELHAKTPSVLLDGVFAAVERNAYHLVVIDRLDGGAERRTAGNLSSRLGELEALLGLCCRRGKVRDTCILVLQRINNGSPSGEFEPEPFEAFVELRLQAGRLLGEEHPSRENADGRTFIPMAKTINWFISGEAGIGAAKGDPHPVFLDTDLWRIGWPRRQSG